MRIADRLWVAEPSLADKVGSLPRELCQAANSALYRVRAIRRSDIVPVK